MWTSPFVGQGNRDLAPQVAGIRGALYGTRSAHSSAEPSKPALGVAELLVSVDADVLMVAKCANPGCKRQFRYLKEGQLFVFHDPRCSCPETTYWWLCADCAATLTLHFRTATGVHVALKTKFEKNECTRCLSLYRECLVESYCRRCGRFIGASCRQSVLTAAEEAHQCMPPRRAFDPVETIAVTDGGRIGT